MRVVLADDIVLVGFSMGTGEVTRYLGRYGSARVSEAALLGAIGPYLRRCRKLRHAGAEADRCPGEALIGSDGLLPEPGGRDRLSGHPIPR